MMLTWNLILTVTLVQVCHEVNTMAVEAKVKEEKVEFAYDYILDELRTFERGQIRFNQSVHMRLDRIESENPHPLPPPQHTER